MTNLLRIPFFIVVTTAVSGQSKETFSGSSLGVSLGAAHYRLIDEAFSHQRQKYHGTPFALHLTCQRTTDRYSLNAVVQAGSGRVAAPDKKFTANLISLQLAVSYARRAVDYQLGGWSNSLYVGGQVRSLNYALEDLDVLEEVSVTFNHTLNLSLSQFTAISPRIHLELAAALPVAGFTKRARLDGGANSDFERDYEGGVIQFLFRRSRLSAMNPFSLPQLSVACVHRTTPKTTLTLTYQFNYASNHALAPVNLYGNALLAGLRFNFNRWP